MTQKWNVTTNYWHIPTCWYYDCDNFGAPNKTFTCRKPWELPCWLYRNSIKNSNSNKNHGSVTNHSTGSYKKVYTKAPYENSLYSSRAEILAGHDSGGSGINNEKHNRE